ncbi:MAG: hypothetical protein J6A67_04935 [Clostridia bacterium]|nr:hypothetical protein [Clostridia bacterium]
MKKHHAYDHPLSMHHENRDRLPLAVTVLGAYYIGARPKATDMALLVQAV